MRGLSSPLSASLPVFIPPISHRVSLLHPSDTSDTSDTSDILDLTVSRWPPKTLSSHGTPQVRIAGGLLPAPAFQLGDYRIRDARSWSCRYFCRDLSQLGGFRSIATVAERTHLQQQFRDSAAFGQHRWVQILNSVH